MNHSAHNRKNCKGVSRRDLIQIGCLTALGWGLADSLRSRALARDVPEPRAKSCILIWLDGGPSHLDTFDIKPDVPSEVRGPFRPISTNVPGIQICEHMPRIAEIADRLSIIRSMTSPLGEHGIANHYLLTGYRPSPVLAYPSFGAVVAQQRGGRHVLPPNVAIPDFPAQAGAGFLGPTYQPFATGGDPAQPGFRVRDLDFYPRVDTARMQRRRRFLDQFEQLQRAGSPLDLADDSEFEQAYRLVTSNEAKRAFRLDEEADSVRARYGSRAIGQSCLLARRLVERGVSFVTVHNPGWDTHEGLALQLRDGYQGAKVGVGLIPSLDLALSALIRDLEERGLLDQTLVLAMGEFGHTPKLNPRGGRDHWPRVFSVLLAGGGVPGGQLIGASDRTGESPWDRPVTPNDLARTIYTLLGVDPTRELQTADGRPVSINQGGELISELT